MDTLACNLVSGGRPASGPDTSSGCMWLGPFFLKAGLWLSAGRCGSGGAGRAAEGCGGRRRRLGSTRVVRFSINNLFDVASGLHPIRRLTCRGPLPPLADPMMRRPDRLAGACDIVFGWLIRAPDEAHQSCSAKPSFVNLTSETLAKCAGSLISPLPVGFCIRVLVSSMWSTPCGSHGAAAVGCCYLWGSCHLLHPAAAA